MNETKKIMDKVYSWIMNKKNDPYILDNAYNLNNEQERLAVIGYAYGMAMCAEKREDGNVYVPIFDDKECADNDSEEVACILIARACKTLGFKTC